MVDDKLIGISDIFHIDLSIKAVIIHNTYNSLHLHGWQNNETIVKIKISREHTGYNFIIAKKVFFLH